MTCLVRRLAILALFFAFGMTYSEPVQAQATRTWVSGVGDDANPCSRTAPCKTFAGAISKTAAAGEISVLDPGGFGAVTITKSISIVSDGSEGSILSALTNGIIINGAGIVVNLHGLFLEGAGTGLNGIRILNAAAVNVRNCQIRGHRGSTTGWAIDMQPSTETHLTVSDCMLTANRGGIHVKPSGAGSARVMLERVMFVNNSTNAIKADGNARVRVSNSTLTQNGIALETINAGTIDSFGNNVVIGNSTNGTFSQTLTLQ